MKDKPLLFVLTDKKFSFLDKSLFILYSLGLIFCFYLLARTFWIDLKINYLGLIIALILLFLLPKIQQKYKDKSRTVKQRRFAKASDYAAEAVSKLPGAYVKTQLSIYMLGILFLVTIIFTIIILAILKLMYVTVFGVYLSLIVFILEGVVFSLFVIKIVIREYRYYNQVAAKINIKYIPLKYKIIAWTIFTLICILVIYRVLFVK